MDLKTTGKQLFVEKYGENAFGDIREEDVVEETKNTMTTGEEMQDSEEEDDGETGALYDRDQFAEELNQQALEEEEPDFD